MQLPHRLKNATFLFRSNFWINNSSGFWKLDVVHLVAIFLYYFLVEFKNYHTSFFYFQNLLVYTWAYKLFDHFSQHSLIKTIYKLLTLQFKKWSCLKSRIVLLRKVCDESYQSAIIHKADNSGIINDFLLFLGEYIYAVTHFWT